MTQTCPYDWFLSLLGSNCAYVWYLPLFLCSGWLVFEKNMELFHSVKWRKSENKRWKTTKEIPLSPLLPSRIVSLITIFQWCVQHLGPALKYLFLRFLNGLYADHMKRDLGQTCNEYLRPVIWTFRSFLNIILSKTLPFPSNQFSVD